MGSQSVNITVDSKVSYQSPSLGDLSTVVITRYWENHEFSVDETLRTVSTLGSYPLPSLTQPKIILKFQNFEPDYVYQTLENRFHDHVVSRKISDEIVVEAQKQSPFAPLLMAIFVTLTQKVFIVVPSYSSPSTTDLETESCSICLENLLSESGTETKSVSQLPSCLHLFHEECVTQWLSRHNSCPLCRQRINQ